MNWSDLVQDILPHVPGCPEPLIEDTIRRMATRLCRDSHCWEEQLADIYIVEGVVRYQVDLPEDTELLSVSYLKYNKGGVKSPVLQWPEINVFGLLSFFECPSVKKGPIAIKVILLPSKAATGMPDRIGEHYREALIAGAIAALQVIPGKDWSAPELAGFHKEIFNEGLREAKARKARGNTNRPLRIAPRPLL